MALPKAVTWHEQNAFLKGILKPCDGKDKHWGFFSFPFLWISRDVFTARDRGSLCIFKMCVTINIAMCVQHSGMSNTCSATRNSLTTRCVKFMSKTGPAKMAHRSKRKFIVAIDARGPRWILNPESSRIVRIENAPPCVQTLAIAFSRGWNKGFLLESLAIIYCYNYSLSRTYEREGDRFIRNNSFREEKRDRQDVPHAYLSIRSIVIE